MGLATRSHAVLALVVVAGLLLTTGPVAAADDPASRLGQRAGNHCIHPSGLDLNEVYGFSGQIVTPFCARIRAGERWTAAGPTWFVNTRFASTPAGFVADGATPTEDFVAKFAGIRYVVDPGTRKERTSFYATSDKLWIGTIPSLAPGYAAIWPGTVSKLRPLGPGHHVVAVYWVFHGMHCDGVAIEAGGSCIGPGVVEYGSPRAFEVGPGHTPIRYPEAR